LEELKKYIRSVPDFPKAGINFYDVTTILHDPTGFDLAVSGMEKFVRQIKPDLLVAAEARGFVFGAALADRLDIGLALCRKPGKLPYKTVSETYELEYGTDSLEIHQDAIASGDKVVIIDDLIATGGTLKATCNLVERLGGVVGGISAVIDLSFLPWRKVLSGYEVNYLVSYDSE